MKFSKVLHCVVIMAMVFSLFLFARPAIAQDDSQPEDTGEIGDFVPGEVVVVFKPGKNMSQYVASATALAKRAQASAVKVQAGGMALLRGDSKADVNEMIKEMEADENVEYAEPNYIYRLPKETTTVGENYLQNSFVIRRMQKSESINREYDLVPISHLQSMKRIKSGAPAATYPNDPYLWTNSGWDIVDADIVSTNATASAAVCVLDTGVDYLHPDLAGKIIKGYDFVNGDADPMDDYGHGTHVAGIITALPNNGKGIAGASRAIVVAVKVLGSQGYGTNFDVASGINYCANRTDVKILNLSLGGSDSTAIRNAVNYAVNTKGKLVVASAGNDNTSSMDNAYPAALSTLYPNKVLAVAASGKTVYVDYDSDGNWDYYYNDYDCRAEYSNYGSWVSLTAPGTDIFSTTPYDKPFYMNYFYNANPRYEYLSGTSMAAPFVAAAASRRWGYKPAETNAQIGADIVESGWEIPADDTCWPASMNGRRMVNIANLMERFEVQASVADASTGLGLNGAQVQAYVGATLIGSAVITPVVLGYQTDIIANVLKVVDVFNYYTAYTSIINLPTSGMYSFKAYKAGYTASPQPVFQHDQIWVYGPATFSLYDRAGIPPKSSNAEVVMGFVQNYSYDYDENAVFDLDLDVWLPSIPNPLDPGQPAVFIVGLEGDAGMQLEGDSTGAMTAFPFARLKRDGGGTDYIPIENITIASRAAHAPLLANPALLYYPGEYVIGVTDFGQTFDHDTNPASPGIHVMGAWAVPYVYIWKDGVIKMFNMMDYQDAGGYCNTTWWKAATLYSGKTGVITYTPGDTCSADTGIFPYNPAP